MTGGDRLADGEPSLRTDARRNRGRILDAARECFAERGLDAQVDEVAATAGVGVGTVYRHFPNKRELLGALAADRFARLTEWALEALEDPDPWAGFESFMRRSAELQANDRGLSEVISDDGAFSLSCAANVREGLLEATGRLVDRARAAGELRDDVEAEEIAMLMCGFGRAIRSESGMPTMPWERYLEIILAGLRAPR